MKQPHQGFPPVIGQRVLSAHQHGLDLQGLLKNPEVHCLHKKNQILQHHHDPEGPVPVPPGQAAADQRLKGGDQRNQPQGKDRVYAHQPKTAQVEHDLHID